MTTRRVFPPGAPVAGALALVVAAVLAATGPSDPSRPAATGPADPAPPAAHTRPHIPAGGSARPVRGDADARPAPGSLHAQRAVARRFLTAFLDYEQGTITQRTARRLRVSTSPALVRELLAAPPRPPFGGPPSRAVLERLEPLGGDADLTELEAILRRGVTQSLITVIVERDHGRPRVTGLR